MPLYNLKRELTKHILDNNKILHLFLKFSAFNCLLLTVYLFIHNLLIYKPMISAPVLANLIAHSSTLNPSSLPISPNLMVIATGSFDFFITSTHNSHSFRHEKNWKKYYINKRPLKIQLNKRHFALFSSVEYIAKKIKFVNLYIIKVINES